MEIKQKPSKVDLCMLVLALAVSAAAVILGVPFFMELAYN